MNLNQSKVKQFRRCQKQFAYRYDYPALFDRAGWEMVRKVQKVQLHRGTWLHALQEAHHREWAAESFGPALVWGESETDGGESYVNEPRRWQQVHGEMVGQFETLFVEEREELGDLPAECLRLFKSYLRFYRSTDVDRYSVAALDDGSPAIEFVIELPLPRIGHTFKGRVDLMVEDHEYGGLWVWDGKWVKSIPIPDERMQSPQACMYVWALRKLGYDVRGFVYNYGRTKPPAIPDTLKRGTLSVKQRMDTDYHTYIQAIKDLHGDQWKQYAKVVYVDKLSDLKGRDALWFRRERIPVEPERIKQALKEYLVTGKQIAVRPKASVAPRSYFYNCRFSCDYHDICCAEFQGLDIEPLVKAKFTFENERYDESEDLLKD